MDSNSNNSKKIIMHLSDSELISMVADKDQEAFVEIFDRYALKIKSFMIKSGSSASDAEEISQEVMAITWMKAKQYFPQKGSVASWIFRISRNYRIDLIRKRKIYDLNEDDPLYVKDDELNSQQILIEQQKRKKIEQAFSNLNKETKNILIASFFEGFTQRELAIKFNKPLGTIKSRLRGAYEFLKECLEPEDFKQE